MTCTWLATKTAPTRSVASGHAADEERHSKSVVSRRHAGAEARKATTRRVRRLSRSAQADK
jgi:hypothetical protein